MVHVFDSLKRTKTQNHVIQNSICWHKKTRVDDHSTQSTLFRTHVLDGNAFFIDRFTGGPLARYNHIIGTGFMDLVLANTTVVASRGHTCSKQSKTEERK